MKNPKTISWRPTACIYQRKIRRKVANYILWAGNGWCMVGQEWGLWMIDFDKKLQVLFCGSVFIREGQITDLQNIPNRICKFLLSIFQKPAFTSLHSWLLYRSASTIVAIHRPPNHNQSYCLIKRIFLKEDLSEIQSQSWALVFTTSSLQLTGTDRKSVV